MTLAEKILSNHCGKDVYAGEIVFCNIDFMVAHDANGPMSVKAFENMGGVKVCDPKKIAIIFDHACPAPYERVANLHIVLRKFASEQDTYFLECGEGVCRQLIVEKGFVKPGDLVLGTDSHTCTYGALGAFSTAPICQQHSFQAKTGLRFQRLFELTLTGNYNPVVQQRILSYM